MKKILFSIFSSALLLTPALFALGQQSGGEFKTQGVTLTRGSIETLMGNIRDWFSGIVGAIAVMMIIYSGFLFLTAGGNPEKIGKAKSSLMYGLIGVGVALLAYGIFALVRSFLQTS